MTIEEITREIDDLSQTVYHLGRRCTDEQFDQDACGRVRITLRLIGEFLKNTSFSMDEFTAVLAEIDNE